MIESLLKSIPTIKHQGKTFKFLFPDNYFYYSCSTCLINCCLKNDKLRLHQDFNSAYSQHFKCQKTIYNLGPCPEFDIDGLCKLEKAHGKKAKPDICNIIPYRILGKYKKYYIVTLNLSDCSLTLSGDTPISIENFFKQTKNIYWDLYLEKINPLLIPKQSLKKESFSQTLESFIPLHIAKQYWLKWNNYYQTQYPYPKHHFFIEGFEHMFFIESHPYLELTPLNKLALIFLSTLYEETTKVSLNTYHFMNMIRDLPTFLKLLSQFEERNCIKKKIDLNSEYLDQLLSFYHLNKNYSVYESLLKLDIKERGSFIMELARFL